MKDNKIPTWKEICSMVPQEIKDLLEQCKRTQQSVKWHPEGNTYVHVKIVYIRARKLGDLDLSVSALFHDLGKTNTTKINPKTNTWSSIGHEFASLKLVEKYKDWIEEIGASYDVVHFVVKEHMRAKRIKEMRPFKRRVLEDHPYYSCVQKFSELDDMQINYEPDLR